MPVKLNRSVSPNKTTSLTSQNHGSKVQIIEAPKVAVPNLPVKYKEFSYMNIAAYVRRFKDSDEETKMESKTKLAEHISMLIGQLINDFGLDNTDYANDAKRVFELIMQRYTDFATKDIREAFELATLHELPDLQPDDYRLFGKLKPEFVCKILNVYRKYYLIPKLNAERQKVLEENEQIRENIQKQKQNYEAINYTLEEYADFLNKKDKHRWEDWRYLIFNLLKSCKMIDDSDEFKMKTLKEKYAKEVISELETERGNNYIVGDNLKATSMNHIIGNLRKKFIDNRYMETPSAQPHHETMIISRVRLQYVREYFVSLSEKNTTPEQLKLMLLNALNIRS
jgi:hypothetical protein